MSKKIADLTEVEFEEMLSMYVRRAACDFPTTKIQTAVKEGVNEALKGLGIDHEHPLEMQKDMAWVRDMREGGKRTRNKAIAVALGVIIPGFIYIVIETFWNNLHKP